MMADKFRISRYTNDGMPRIISEFSGEVYYHLREISVLFRGMPAVEWGGQSLASIRKMRTIAHLARLVSCHFM
jgi:hypothetical protein